MMTKLLNRFKIKLNNKSGETLVETLVALLIAAMGLVLVPGAVMSAARVNNSIKNSGVYIDAGTEAQAKSPASAKLSITVDTNNTTPVTLNVDGKTEENGNTKLYYYTIPSELKNSSAQNDPAAGN